MGMKNRMFPALLHFDAQSILNMGRRRAQTLSCNGDMIQFDSHFSFQMVRNPRGSLRGQKAPSFLKVEEFEGAESPLIA